MPDRYSYGVCQPDAGSNCAEDEVTFFFSDACILPAFPCWSDSDCFGEYTCMSLDFDFPETESSFCGRDPM